MVGIKKRFALGPPGTFYQSPGKFHYKESVEDYAKLHGVETAGLTRSQIWEKLHKEYPDWAKRLLERHDWETCDVHAQRTLSKEIPGYIQYGSAALSTLVEMLGVNTDAYYSVFTGELPDGPKLKTKQNMCLVLHWLKTGQIEGFQKEPYLKKTSPAPAPAPEASEIEELKKQIQELSLQVNKVPRRPAAAPNQGLVNTLQSQVTWLTEKVRLERELTEVKAELEKAKEANPSKYNALFERFQELEKKCVECDKNCAVPFVPGMK
jgi:hypothetical protein